MAHGTRKPNLSRRGRAKRQVVKNKKFAVAQRRKKAAAAKRKQAAKKRGRVTPLNKRRI